jgi:uncharacterized cupredoxin-like copper-binding protein
MNRYHLAIACLLGAPLPALAHPSLAEPHHAAAAPSAAGRSGDPAQVTRTVSIGMADSMRFAPAALQVKQGETIRIVARNDGQVLHEIVLGSAADIARHRAAMQRDPGMAHGAPYMAHVAPGASADIVWKFDRAGEFEYACLLPGHYEAGMRGAVTVDAPAAPRR